MSNVRPANVKCQTFFVFKMRMSDLSCEMLDMFLKCVFCIQFAGLQEYNHGDSSSTTSNNSSRSSGSSSGSSSSSASSSSSSSSSSSTSDSSDSSANKDNTDMQHGPSPPPEAIAVMVDQQEFTQLTIADCPSPETFKEIGVELRYLGGHVIMSDDNDLASYIQQGGCITLTSAAVSPKDCLRGKGARIHPSCERMLACGQHFVMKGDLFCVLGLLWVGFGKPFKGRKGSKKKNPKAPLLVLAAPPSFLDIASEDVARYTSKLVLLVAHHVLESASFAMEKIRRSDISKLATIFASICSRYHKNKKFWQDLPRM